MKRQFVIFFPQNLIMSIHTYVQVLNEITEYIFHSIFIAPVPNSYSPTILINY